MRPHAPRSLYCLSHYKNFRKVYVMSKKVTCPVCYALVSVNERTFSIRKHRIGGKQKGEVCAGSHRLYLTPADLSEAPRTHHHVVYIAGLGLEEYPIYATEDINEARKVANMVGFETRISSENIDDVCKDAELDLSCIDFGVRFFYIPQFLTATVQSTWGSTPHIYSRSCPSLLAVTRHDPQLLRALRVLYNVTERSAPSLTSFVQDAILFADQGRFVGEQPSFAMSYYVVASIIKAHHKGRAALTSEDSIQPLHQAVWSLLFSKAIPRLSSHTLILLGSVLESAESELLRSAPKAGLRKHLIQLIDLQDIVYAQQTVVDPVEIPTEVKVVEK